MNYHLTYRSHSGTTISQIVPAENIVQAASIGDARLQNDRTLKGFTIVAIKETVER